MLWKEEYTGTLVTEARAIDVHQRGGSGFTRIFLGCYGRSSGIQMSKEK
jgi:hypothetical protein